MEMAWGRLQARSEHPSAVLGSVSAGAMQKFLSMLAINPLSDTSDAVVVKKLLSGLRAKRSANVLVSHAYVGSDFFLRRQRRSGCVTDGGA